MAAEGIAVSALGPGFLAEIENDKDGIIAETPTGIITRLNRAAELILAIEAPQALGRPFCEFLDPGDHQLGRACSTLPSVDGQSPVRSDAFLIRADRSLVEVSIDSYRMRGPDGSVVGALRMFRERSHDVGLAILDQLPSMVGYWDANLINRFANRAYSKWFGVEPSQLLGHHLKDLLGEALFERNRPYIEGALAGAPQQFERSIPRPDGQGVRHSLAYYLPDIRAGQVLGFQVLVNDVTELTESRARLEAAVKDREVYLHELHHRVKNNLQTITSMINIQLRKLGDQTSRTALEECQNRVRAIALVHEKLYRARDHDRLELRDYVQWIAGSLLETAGVPRSQVALEIRVDDLDLSIDQGVAFGLILNELVTNCLKHAFADGRAGRISIEVEQLEPSAARVVVADDGPGLPKGADLSTSDSAGLVIVRALVRQLNGTLVIEDHAGLKAIVTFPIAQSHRT